jgi:hypothetical protein
LRGVVDQPPATDILPERAYRSLTDSSAVPGIRRRAGLVDLVEEPGPAGTARQQVDGPARLH